ncbi:MULTISPECIES: carboxylating nicotinate-nucleotide diphosphorylase [unclassified Imperialibacter]|uniref:carboxylating nicotinate-nucleotide diphosphorylase n=1 Tax=unclassified Imperialibacter TaxID=2629706 RepID=UPI00125AE629|nr:MULTISPECIES: carboxylating nicotinate-nucleotide diphosphorylase [unclassified Imperialibacter]CAD5271960.1 putative nicotinate-nucleotide pyrophosphorylase (carboxylating) [Imperialibacter sp. 89]CAD5299143.1 putative nicotinate-nucleotide pyrophosphorylase (carboxylating) [Imperialibacter sp. 75]VVT35148.1 putative nicotinate-nucleotide pyrophosphorylase (carboxylating) [Imperialibacter sp. EC-SDR9]
MKQEDFFYTQLNALVENALAEDIGEGDHSTLSTVPAGKQGKARLLVKDDGIIAGMDVAKFIFHKYDPALQFIQHIEDGSAVKAGDIAFELTGSARSILTTERLVLNCMQRMSGIATYTNSLSSMISHTKAKLLDTRKTTPNFRLLEKRAVEIGGGKNHRFALYDMIMLKDNHIDMAGGISSAIQSAKSYLKELGKGLKIEVETRSMAEVNEVLAEGGVDFIMLDNMSTTEMKKAVALIAGKAKVEASGGITEKTIKEIAETGVDFISVGALTHSYKSLDLSLKVVIE